MVYKGREINFEKKKEKIYEVNGTIRYTFVYWLRKSTANATCSGYNFRLYIYLTTHELFVHTKRVPINEARRKTRGTKRVYYNTY